MRAGWQELPRGDIRPENAGIHVTMNPKGEIVMSRVTYQMLGEPKAFVILFDKVNNRIGLNLAALGTRNAYPISVPNPTGGRKVRAHRLIREYRIDLPETVYFHDADIDQDGILVLDLRTAKISPRAAARNRFIATRRSDGDTISSRREMNPK